MANATINLPVPPPMKISDNADIADRWKHFRADWENYAIATELDKKESRVQVAVLYSVMGHECFRIAENLPMTAAERTDQTSILDKLEEHFKPNVNLTYQRWSFNSLYQDENESFESFLSRIRESIKVCKYVATSTESLEDQLIKDRIVVGIRNKSTMQKFLNDPQLTLQKAINMCKVSEQTAKQLEKMAKAEEEVNKVNTWKKDRGKVERREQYEKKGSFKKESRYKRKEYKKKCIHCGELHNYDRDKCPAYGEICFKCNKKNHFARCCKDHKVHSIESDKDSETSSNASEAEQSILSVRVNNSQNKLYAELKFVSQARSKKIKCQLDTGATCNVMNFEDLCRITNNKKPKLEKPSARLRFYNGETARTMGTIKLKCLYRRQMHEILFQIVETGGSPIIGAPTSLEMKLIVLDVRVIREEFKSFTKEEIVNRYKDVFKGMGCLPGEYQIQLDAAIQPIKNQPRRIPVAIREQVKEKINELEKKGIIDKITTPTDWISSLVVVKKKDKLRICLDPRDLNTALKRSHYQLPTMEEILPKLGQAKVFSVLDAKEGFWQVKLDSQSSLLTTFWTPFGRYKWNRMPFGISTAPEEFQRRLHEIFEGMTGVEVIADDVLIYGNGATEEEAAKDHDDNLMEVLEKARRVNLKFNKEKFKYKMDKVPYMGHLLTKDGLKPDERKVEAIMTMPRPTNKTEVQRVLGFVNYIAKFMPKLSEISYPLRQLLDENYEWKWHQPQEEAFEIIKKLATTTPVLKYYQSDQPVTIQCDASEKGLGATLLQEEQPVAFASRALTQTEQSYAQIEKECLAIVFACEKFYQYICGKIEIIVHSDHKPLETIFKKSVLKAPRRLQRMLLRLQSYNLKVVHKKGKLMYIADLLSRAFKPQKRNKEEEMQFEVYRLKQEQLLYQELEQINMTDNINLKEDKLRRIQSHTNRDVTLQKLMETILTGWPENKTESPLEIREYWAYRDELGVQNGVVFKGMKVIIPKAMRREMVDKIHESHLGIAACIRRGRDVIFWPRMSDDIRARVETCETCREADAAQQKLPLVTHQTPERPWQRIAMDIFQHKEKNYLVVVDYYSDFWEVDKLKNVTAETVINICKRHFSTHGIPEIVDSDAGTQFNCAQFRKFAMEWGFEHCTSSPYHHQSNGKAESAVKIAKKILKKTDRDNIDFWKAVLNWRNTPTEGIESSPVQRLMSRRTNTDIPTTGALLKPVVTEEVTEKINYKKIKYKEAYDKNARYRRELIVGENIRVQLNPERRADKWIRGTIQQQLDPRSYIVNVDGHLFRRNSTHIRPDPTMTEETNREEEDSNPSDDIIIDNTGDRTSPSSNEEQPQREGRNTRPPKKFDDYVMY